MQTTKFRVWVQNPQVPPVWTGVKLVDSPKYIEADCLEMTVQVKGYDLRRLIAHRGDIFAAYLQMKTEKRGTMNVTKEQVRPHQEELQRRILELIQDFELKTDWRVEMVTYIPAASTVRIEVKKPS